MDVDQACERLNEMAGKAQADSLRHTREHRPAWAGEAWARYSALLDALELVRKIRTENEQ